MASSKIKHIERQRINSIKWIIEDFLEEGLDFLKLESDFEKTKELAEGLQKNLWGQHSVKTMDETFDLVGPKETSTWGKPRMTPLFENILHEPKDLDVATAQSLAARNLSKYYRDLKSLWNSFKSGIGKRKFYGGIHHEIAEVKILIDYSLNNVSFDKGLFIKMSFISLIEGAPFSIFRKCQGPGCNRWFVSTHKTKKYCQEKCGGRNRQVALRKRDPEKYKSDRREYQKKKYREKILGK